MKISKYFKHLEEILNKNYRALGFELKSFEVSGRTGDTSYIIAFLVACPCGGTEFFTFRSLLGEQRNPEVLAKTILRRSASREHLEDDVEKGLLPPFDYEKHVFEGELV